MNSGTPIASLLAATLLVGMASRAAVAAETFSQKAEVDKTVKVVKGDVAMEAAFDRARATLPAFYETMLHPAAGMKNFAVKVGLPTSQGTEFVWLSSPSMRDGQVRGIIGNELEYATKYRKGQRVQFPETAVVDWMYMEAGKMKGNFTACALASKLSQQERREFEQEYGIDCTAQK